MRLHRYAAWMLHSHMSATDLSLADRTLKAEVGELTVKVLTEEYAIDSLFGLGFRLEENSEKSALVARILPDFWSPWIVTGEASNLLALWLKDSAVTENLKNHKYVSEFNSTRGSTEQLLFMFGPFAKSAAKHILRRDAEDREYEEAFLLLLAMKAKVVYFH